MIVDNTLVLSDNQAITATAASTNTWDRLAQGTPYGWTSAYGSDAGEGFMDIPLLVEVTETFATLTSLTLSIETDDNAGFSSATTVYTSPAVVAASLVAGYVFRLHEIPNGVLEQYVRLKYTVAGSSATAGKIFAGVVAGHQTNTH